MNARVDFSMLTALSEMQGEDNEDSRLLKMMADDAQQYLLSFAWCSEIKAGWFGCGIGGICAVFFFEIVPGKPNVDDSLWVIVGDLPPAYLVVDRSPTPLMALQNYVELIHEWVNAVKAGKSTSECIPVNVVPTTENADLLELRLDLIKKWFLQ